MDYLTCVPWLLEDVAITFGENGLKLITDCIIVLVEMDLAMYACTIDNKNERLLSMPVH